MNSPIVYTPAQVAKMLQLSKNTVYDLIARGEIVAKKLGKVYRIPASSVNFIFSGLDIDIQKAEKKDLKRLSKVQGMLSESRKQLWRGKSKFL